MTEAPVTLRLQFADPDSRATELRTGLAVHATDVEIVVTSESITTQIPGRFRSQTVNLSQVAISFLQAGAVTMVVQKLFELLQPLIPNKNAPIQLEVEGAKATIPRNASKEEIERVTGMVVAALKATRKGSDAAS